MDFRIINACIACILLGGAIGYQACRQFMPHDEGAPPPRHNSATTSVSESKREADEFLQQQLADLRKKMVAETNERYRAEQALADGKVARDRYNWLMDWCKKNGCLPNFYCGNDGFELPVDLCDFLGWDALQVARAKQACERALNQIKKEEARMAVRVECTADTMTYEIPPLPRGTGAALIEELATIADPRDLEMLEALFQNDARFKKNEYTRIVSLSKKKSMSNGRDLFSRDIFFFDAQGKRVGSERGNSYEIPERWRHLFGMMEGPSGVNPCF